jgi:uncharacterized protein (TIGR02594 family)
MEPKWLNIARGELGVKEKAGKEANPRIVEYFEAAGSNVSSDEVPWCSAFACWVMEQAGYPSTNNAAARSWLKYGKPTPPKPGAIAIFPRGTGWQGHVAIVEKVIGNQVTVIGGNQGNAVTRRNMHIKSALGFRWPSTVRNSNTMAAGMTGGISTVLGFAGDMAQEALPLAQEATDWIDVAKYACFGLGIVMFIVIMWRRYQKMKAGK